MRSHMKAVVAFAVLLVTTLAIGALPAAADAPLVVIEDAGDVSHTSAGVKGTVNPQGQSTPYRFQFIPDAQYEENLGNGLPGFEGAATGIEGSVEGSGAQSVEGTLAGLTPGTEYHLRLVAENGDGQSEATAASTFETLPAPVVVTIDPPTEVGGTTARFSGMIDPEAPAGNPAEFNVSWFFRCEPGCSLENDPRRIPADSEVHLVERDVRGLQPNTEYKVWLVATSFFDVATSTTGPESFTTLQVAPEAQTLGAGYVGERTATLAANVNPKNSPATYAFEWGTDESYGNVVPATPQPLGAVDNSAHFVSAELSGLLPGTTYHYRVVATNVDTSVVGEGQDRTFATLEPSGAPTPPSRAFEMVSPTDKGGGEVDRDFTYLEFNTSGAAADGSAVAFASRNQFGDLEGGSLFPTYRSVRHPGGWVTAGITPPGSPIGPGVSWPRIDYLSEDLRYAVVRTDTELTPDVALLNGAELGMYLRDADAVDPAQRYRLLTVPDSLLPPGGKSNDTQFSGATPDLSRVVISSSRQLLPEAPPGQFSETPQSVYEWVDGELNFVSELPPGTPTPDIAFGGGEKTFNGQQRPGSNPISDDGRRIFFTAGVAGGNAGLYVREDGVKTILVSSSERVGDDPDIPREGKFLGASAADGSIVFFSSMHPLTDDAVADSQGENGTGADLYRWDADAPAGSRLEDLTSADPGGAFVLGDAGVSDDGSRIYFVARGALAQGAQSGRPNLYLWEEGVGVRLIATLADILDRGVWSQYRGLATSYRGGTTRLSVDGSRFLFESVEKLTAYDNQGRYQSYLYDAGLDRLVCVSCNRRTAASSGDAQLWGLEAGMVMPFRQPRNLSADGSRVFFESHEQLVSGDVNQKADVYEWSDEGGDLEGDLRLISTGHGSSDSEFIDASESGDDVFFTTRDRLVGIDADNQVDAYDARVGGGIASQNPPPSQPPCGGEGCQPAPPASSTPSPASFTGPGNSRARDKRWKARCMKQRGAKRRKCLKKASKQRANRERRAAR